MTGHGVNPEALEQVIRLANHAAENPDDPRWVTPAEQDTSVKADIELALMQREQLLREAAAVRRAWAWSLRWLRMQGDGNVIAAQVVTVMESRLRQEMAK